MYTNFVVDLLVCRSLAWSVPHMEEIFQIVTRNLPTIPPGQAASYNEQRVAAHVNIEYCYLHYHSGINKNDTLCSFQCEDCETYEDSSLFGGKKLYPNTLARSTCIQPLMMGQGQVGWATATAR